MKQRMTNRLHETSRYKREARGATGRDIPQVLIPQHFLMFGQGQTRDGAERVQSTSFEKILTISL